MRVLLTSFILSATTFATQALAIDNCLIGTWRADLTDLAAVMATQMNGQAQITSGGAHMQIATSGDVTILVDRLVIRMAVPGTPPFDVTITGYSSGIMTTVEGAWTLNASDYNLAGSADVLGSTLTIPFTSATGMFGGGLGEYGCSTNSLSFESTGATARIPLHWTR